MFRRCGTTGGAVRRGIPWLAVIACAAGSFGALALLSAAGSPGISSAVAAARLNIDQIELEGVKTLTQTDVENALEIFVGDELDRGRVHQSAENLRGIYFSRGYQHVEVKTELIRRRVKSDNGRTERKNILVFRIEEGAPTRISRYMITAPDLKDEAAKELWRRLLPKLRERVKIRPGSVLDQEALSDARRMIESGLAGNEFVGAKAKELIVKPGEAPAGVANAGEATKWVDVEIPVDIGDRVTFGFRGNQRFTQGELREHIEEMRLLGFSRDYVTEIGEKIAQLYRSKGYAHVKISPYTFERGDRQERHVTYVIDEGRRVRIRSVSFDGNDAFSAGRLRSEFYDRASILVERDYYVEEEVEKAAELVADFMKSEGFLSAKIVTVNRKFVKGGSEVEIVVYLYEGQKTTVRDVHLDGITALSREEVLETLGIEPGRPLDLFQFNEGLEALKTRYREEGYLGVSIANEDSNEVVRYFQKNQLADIHLDVSEGPRYRLSAVEIEGLRVTKREVVSREVQVDPGDVLRADLVADTESRIRRLGLFSSVKLEARDDPKQTEHKILKITVQEGTPGAYGLGIGWRNDLGARVFGEVSYANLWRQNHTIVLAGNVNRRLEDFRFAEFQLQASYHWPWFAGGLLGDVTFRPELIWERQQFILLDADTVSPKATLERRLTNAFDVVAALTYSFENIREYNSKDGSEDLTLSISSVVPSLRLDLRDNPLAPTRGFYLSGSFELGSGGASAAKVDFPVGYTRFIARADTFIPLWENATWFFSFRTGFARNTIDPDTLSEDKRRYIGIPLVKQFALGGVGSIRGYKLQEINNLDILITGTQAFVNYRTQIDMPLSGSMRFGPFLDAGNLIIDGYTLGALTFGTGVGLHYQTPVGPVNFDWGVRLDPPPGEDRSRFHFSVGIL